MKRLVLFFGIFVVAGALAVPVLAFGPGWGRGGMMGYWGGGSGYCGAYSGDYGSLTQKQRTSLDELNRKFFDETDKLRREIWSKRAELNALLNTTSPDAGKARALQNEISDLRSKVAEARLNFQLQERKIAPDTRLGWGYGRGYGRHMGGYGPGMGHGWHMGNYGPGMGYGWHMGGYGSGACWN